MLFRYDLHSALAFCTSGSLIKILKKNHSLNQFSCFWYINNLSKESQLSTYIQVDTRQSSLHSCRSYRKQGAREYIFRCSN